MTPRTTRVLQLLAGLWILGFLGGTALLFPQSLNFVGVTPLFGGVGDWLSLWKEIGETVATSALLVGTLYLCGQGIRRFVPFRWEEFFVLSIGPVTGVWVSIQRFSLSHSGADFIARIEPALLGLGIPVALTSLGSLLMRGLLPLRNLAAATSSPLSVYVILATVGGSVGWGVLLFLSALVGWWKVNVLWGFVIGVGVFGLPGIVTDLMRLPRPDSGEPNRSIPDRFLFFFLLVLLHGCFQLACLPPDDSDELRYHLSIPRRYLEAEGYTEIPDQAFSHFPLGMEMLWVPGQSLDLMRPKENRFGFVSSGKWTHAWFSMMTLLVLLVWIREFGGSRVGGVLPAWVFLAVPFVPVISSWAFVDLGVSFGWLGAAFSGWMAFRGKGGLDDTGCLNEPGSSPGTERSALHRSADRWTVVCSLFLGWSLMVKYTGLAWYAFLVGTWAFHSLFGVRDRPVKNLVTVVTVPVLCAAPWFLLNAIQTGNPFYPLFSGVFGTGFDPVQKAFYAWHAGMKGNLNQFQTLSLAGKTLDLILLPFRASLFPWQFENNPIGGMIPAFFLLFLIGVFAEKRCLGFVGASTLFLFFLWAFTYRDPRFALPLWALVSLGAGIGADRVFGEWFSGKGLLRSFRYGGIAFLVLWGLGQNDELFRRLRLYSDVINLREPASSYLEKRLPVFRAVEEVERLRRNLETQPKPTLLLLGQEQSYYFGSPVRGADYFDGPWLAKLARDCDSLEEMTERIVWEGIDWIFINRNVLEGHPFNVVRGALFTMKPDRAVKEIGRLRFSSPVGLRRSDQERILEEAEHLGAFRRMQAWLIVHPGFEEVPLASVREKRHPVSPFYRSWTHWPELETYPIDRFPRREFSLLRRSPGELREEFESPPGGDNLIEQVDQTF